MVGGQEFLDNSKCHQAAVRNNEVIERNVERNKLFMHVLTSQDTKKFIPTENSRVRSSFNNFEPGRETEQ
ncbi:hypothetical protein BpHYR1_016057, partial [Brachionus plicatilis]